MFTKIHIIFTFLLFCSNFFITNNTYAQHTTTSLPVQIGQFTSCYPLINPAFSGTESDFEVNLGSQNHNSLWKNISSFYFHFNNRIRLEKKTSVNTKHTSGATFIGDQEGVFLGKTKAYGVYSIHKRISKKLSLSAGTALGIINYNVKATYSNEAASSAAIDGNTGILLKGSNFHAGFSVNQWPHASLQPIAEVTEVIRHFNCVAGKSFIASPKLKINTASVVRFVPGFKPDIDFNANFLLNNLLGFGGNFRYNKAIVAIISLQRVNIGTGDFDLLFSYTIPYGNSVFGSMKTYEIGINYIIKNNDKKIK